LPLSSAHDIPGSDTSSESAGNAESCTDPLSRRQSSSSKLFAGIPCGLPHIGPVGDTYTITASGGDTNGRFCVIDMHIPPGGGPTPHRHDSEETFIVLEGEIEATCRGKAYTAKAGATVNIPSNAPHRFHITSSSPARLICICSPAGLDQFFQRIGVPVSDANHRASKAHREEEQQRFIEKARALAPEYRTELLEEALGSHDAHRQFRRQSK
jgi:quercetin dioxygenase-like cupin family protein